MADVFKKYDAWFMDIQKAYRPFLTTDAVNKYSRRHQYFCPVQSRIIHLLSDGELYAYKGLITTLGITQVFEQFALDPECTVDVAETLGFKHPMNPKTGQPYIMSTDFVVNRNTKRTAYTFKYHSDLYLSNCNRITPNKTKWRTWQKLAIENAYWKRQGIEYRIVTELDFPKAQVFNLSRCEYAANFEYADEFIYAFIKSFMQLWMKNPHQVLEKIISQCADIILVECKQCVSLFHHCVINNKLHVDHSVKFQMHLPIQLIAEESSYV